MEQEVNSHGLHHRIDGLEIVHVKLWSILTFQHRIDGLEKVEKSCLLSKNLQHRIDGLEK